MSTADATPVSAAEAHALFADLDRAPALVLAVSGGPDSTALMWLAARWRASLRRKPDLLAVTVDHGLRSESACEAAAVQALAARLDVPHRILRWSGRKPVRGLQEAAREARYRLLAAAAGEAGARHVLTAHTLDDQAETVLMRLAHGSGPAGLAAMARESARGDIVLVRPLLEIPKHRLVATLQAAGIAFAQDPSNADPRFTRARLRAVMAPLAQEGLSAARLATLARRMRRLDAAMEALTDVAAARFFAVPEGRADAVRLEAAPFAALPAELRLRLLGRAVARAGHEGPVALRKLESLAAALDAAAAENGGLRRTLAGALVTLRRGVLMIEPAPARRPTGTPAPTRSRRVRLGVSPDRPGREGRP